MSSQQGRDHRRRSISPRRDGPSNYRERDSGYSGSSTRGNLRSDRGGRDGRGGFQGGRGGHSGASIGPSLPDLPDKVDVPASGRKLPEMGLKMVGKAGATTRIIVNHYELQSLPTTKIYQYQIRMRVPESSQRKGSEKVSAAQEAKALVHASFQGTVGLAFVYDGVSMGYSPQKLCEIGTKLTSMIDLFGHTTARPNQVEVTILNTGTLNIALLVNYMQSKKMLLNPMGNEKLEPLLKWLNAVYRSDPSSRFVTRPNVNAYFERTPETVFNLQSTGGILEAIRGMFQTVQIRFGKLTINVDTTTTAFYVPDRRLTDLCHAMLGIPYENNLENAYLGNEEKFLAGASRLIGIHFCVRHLSQYQNSLKRKLRNFTRSNAIETTFEVKDGSGSVSEISVYDHFQNKYNIKLRYPKLPLAHCRDGDFPLEVCFSAPGERYKELLQGAETADFIKFATSPAFTRHKQITENAKKLHWHELSVPKSHGLSVETKMIELPGRILPAPTPQYLKGTDPSAPSMGVWNLRNKKLLRPASITSWGMLYFPTSKRQGLAVIEDFSRAIIRNFRSLGIEVPSSPPTFLMGNPQGAIDQIIAELGAKTQSTFGGIKPQALFFVFDAPSDFLYKGIKHACDVKFGVASQVIIATKALRINGQDQYIANLGLKVNVKLGGTNSIIRERMFQDNRWMIMGGDTSHPTPGQLRQNPPPPSFSALVATYDRDCAAYTAVATGQPPTEQLISSFGAMFKEIIERYKVKNGDKLPEKILYYRDGLSEGQFQQIKDAEGQAMKQVCESLGGSSRPRITIVICVKRHHTRMFPTERGDKNGNVLPGTVVENSMDNDIFLVAHAGLQGTNRPTRYAVLVDENNLSADDFQRITNNLCWSYARATRAVSVVPPVYYADQACERAKLHVRHNDQGQSILGGAHADLRFSMYWQ